MREYNGFLEAVLGYAKQGIRQYQNIGFYGYEFACCVMDHVAACAETEIGTDEGAEVILDAIGYKKIRKFYEDSKRTYTGIYSVAETPESDEPKVDFLEEPFKFITEMAGMLGCEIAYHVEGYGTEELNADEQRILNKFDSDEGGEITDKELETILARVTIDKVAKNTKLFKTLM